MENSKGAGAPAPAAETRDKGNGAAAKVFEINPRTQALTLSAWDLARTRTKQPDTNRGQIMTLRTHQKLVTAFEDARGVTVDNRSYLRVRDAAKGSCLLVHGVSTSPGDLKALAEEFVAKDFNVYVLRLPDYGTGGSTLSEISWESALAQARQCYQLLARGGGKVINISSVAGLEPQPMMGVYSVSKAAVIMLTKVLAAELASMARGLASGYCAASCAVIAASPSMS